MKRCLLLLLLAATSVQAQQPFEAAVSGDSVHGCYILPVSFSGVEWIDPDRLETPTDIAMIASRDGQTVYAVLKGPGARIVKVEADGTRTPFFQDPASSAWALDVGPDGRLFVAMFIAGTYQLGVISPAGVFETSYPMPGASYSTSLAVADDGCTVYYFGYSGMRRINGCTGAVLSDFLIPPPGTSSVRDVDPLPNGQVLVAIDDRVDLYDAAGTLIRTVASLPSYGLTLPEVGQVIADNHGSQVWLTASGCDSQGQLLRVSFSTGAELSRREIELNTPTALILGAARTNDLPIGNGALLILALGIAVIALLRIQ